MRRTIVVFARAPDLGHVKTRLARHFPPDDVLRLYRAMLGDTLDSARRSGARVVLAHTPSSPFDEQRMAHETIVQRGGKFGERFDAALEDAASWTGSPFRLLIIGADAPLLGTAALGAAFEALERHDVVVAPAPRGGFCLLGFRDRTLAIQSAFDAADQVVAIEVLARENGRSVTRIPDGFDIDEAEDVQGLADALLRLPVHDARAARTRLALDSGAFKAGLRAPLIADGRPPSPPPAPR
jgi:hypothetical protein